MVDCDLPLVSNYVGDRPGAPTMRTRGLVPEECLQREIVDLSTVTVPLRIMPDMGCRAA